MRLPRGFADEVRNQSDILRVVSDYVVLKKRGSSYVARCPFHSEKTPSFNVNPSRGMFHCFGCGAGGSVFDFVMRIDGCTFPEAVRVVAEKSGIPIPEVNDSEDYKKQAAERDIILRLNGWAAEFFELQLRDSKDGERARQYAVDRGISEAATKEFRLGWAPDRWDALTEHLRERGATLEEINLSGLAIMKEAGGLHDRFRSRLMFP